MIVFQRGHLSAQHAQRSPPYGTAMPPAWLHCRRALGIRRFVLLSAYRPVLARCGARGSPRKRAHIGEEREAEEEA